MLGLVLVFIKYPVHPGVADNRICQVLDVSIAGCVILCFGYVLIQTEPLFEGLWINGKSLGDRAAAEHPLDYLIGAFGLICILEATRRTVGMTLMCLALAFIVYAGLGQFMPDWLFPHRGYSLRRIISQTFLQSQGTFGIALRVMFTYVFLFVLFGAVLAGTGATRYVLSLARRLFGTSAGGPAKVAVLSSGMMGSLSGSAVANTATTGTFTIPLMRRAGFQPPIAGGIEAAASSGGALVPPIMGAGAYMMLEIVSPPVTYLAIIKAALLPAILYYTALLCIVHFYAKRIEASKPQADVLENQRASARTTAGNRMQGVVFLTAFVTLIGFLLLGATAFRAVSLSLLAVLGISLFHAETRIGMQGGLKSMVGAAESGVSLIAAAACVGIILGVVTLTGIGSKLPSALLPLAATNLILALLLLMVSTIILGMGLPSSVCYLLMAILVGPVLLDLGVVPLAAHFFIFYFGMMSMVTPPVALAAYTAAAIANSGIMSTGLAAFRFALVGFALPYAFVLRPELLWLSTDGGNPGLWAVSQKLTPTLIGTVIFASSIAGYAFNVLSLWERVLLFIAAIIFFFTPISMPFLWLYALAVLGSTAIFYYNWQKKRLPS